METSLSIRENLDRVRERIARAAERAGRRPADVAIVAVTKTHGPETVTAAIEAGITDVGENRVQEFLAKAPAVALPCRWHLVGHLQTNKVAKAVGRFALIQSVDSLKLAEHIGRTGETIGVRGAAGVTAPDGGERSPDSAGSRGVSTDILLEVNTSGGPSKYGFAPEETLAACALIAKTANVRIRGLMTVGPLAGGTAAAAASFERLRRLADEIRSARIESVSMEHLSMGMSDDFETAIIEGSTT